MGSTLFMNCVIIVSECVMSPLWLSFVQERVKTSLQIYTMTITRSTYLHTYTQYNENNKLTTENTLVPCAPSHTSNHHSSLYRLVSFFPSWIRVEKAEIKLKYGLWMVLKGQAQDGTAHTLQNSSVYYTVNCNDILGSTTFILGNLLCKRD